MTDRLHPFLTVDAGPDERADLGAGLDRLVWGEVAGVCFLAFASIRYGMPRCLSPFPDDDTSARATDTAEEACHRRLGGNARLPPAADARAPAGPRSG